MLNDTTQIQAFVPAIDFFALAPFLILLIGAILCLVVDAASNKNGSRARLPWIAGGSLVLSALSFFMGWLPEVPFMENTFYSDAFGMLGCIVILFAALMTTAMAPILVERRNLPSGEFYTLILFASLGGILLATANELLTAFISLEIMSISLYVLVGIDRRSAKAAEASFKYFILGAFASAFLVMGIAFLYGATHTTFLNEMAQVFRDGGAINAATGEITPINPFWVYVGFALMLVGMCFKLGLAPFHMYVPDVYEGGNTPSVIFIATGSKVATFAIMVHIVASLSFWPPFETGAVFVIGLVAVASMLWGNLGALVQSNFKRMMAYSSIAQTGYIAVALLVLVSLPRTMTGEALVEAQIAIQQAIVLYLGGYTIMSALAFGIAFLIGGEGHMAGYRGLIFRNPLAATGMAIAMFSLVGIGFTPPTIGFMGKFYLFKEAVQHGYVVIACIAVLASVISAFYYLSLVVTMFMRDQTQEGAVRLAGLREQRFTFLSSDSVTRMLLGVCSVLIFLFGIYPQGFIGLAETISTGLFGGN